MMNYSPSRMDCAGYAVRAGEERGMSGQQNYAIKLGICRVSFLSEKRIILTDKEFTCNDLIISGFIEISSLPF